ncbi:MAG: TadG family pilus assembly protein [Deltaproteobacteria bacterium]|nr:TadG family pilus assembly protein [Deltaproteobacteria bacterium]
MTKCQPSLALGKKFLFLSGWVAKGQEKIATVRNTYMKSWRGLCHWEDKKGLAATSVVALLMLLAVAAVLVDLGRMFMVRWQIQDAAEAGATAGARSLAYGTTLNFQMAVNTATATVRKKLVDGVLLSDFNSDGSLQEVQAGYWDLSWTKDTAPACLNGYTDPENYVPSANEVPSVKVNVVKSSSGPSRRAPLTAYFASFLGFSHVDAATFAVAIRPGGAHVYGAGVQETKLVE